jgi:hypothetical protein
MKRVAVFLPIIVFLAACCSHWTGATRAEAAGRADELAKFEKRIRPLLIARCGKCHSGKAPKAGLDLLDVKRLMAGGRSGPVIVPGNATGSRLVQAVRRTGRGRMPPDKPLLDSQIVDLVTWVRNGAVVSGPLSGDRRRGGDRITEGDREWWSFRPVVAVPVPGSDSPDRWSRSPIDRFVLARLVEEGLRPSEPADRRTLLRRATFDLWGVPPTPEEVEAFLRDRSPEAFARVVDRLLASPRYGERWGRHWLDVVRYADTNGGGFDYVYPNAWRYRDYVIASLNRDLPYNRFLVEQIAGDLLPPADDDETAIARLVATGFLTLAPKGLGMQDKELMAMDVVDDQIDVVGRALMGLTFSCARCHDHKFDPLLMTDYYALAGIFRSTVSLTKFDKNPSGWPERPVEAPSVKRARLEHKRRVSENTTAIDGIVSVHNRQLVQDARRRLVEYLFVAAAVYHAGEGKSAVAHWPFDSISGATVSATAGPVGRLSNTSGKADGPRPLLVDDGKIGKALRFSGQGAIVDVKPGQLDVVSLGKTGDFSVSLWLRAPSGYKPATADSIVSAKYKSSMWFIALRPGGFNGIYLRHYNGKAAVDIKPSTDQLPRLTDGGWHHVAFTSDRDGSGLVYLDGQPSGRTGIKPVSGTADYSKPESLRIGASTNGFRGDLDDVALWDRVLEPAEIGELFRLGGRKESPVDVAAIQRRRVTSDGRPSIKDLLGKHRVVPSLARRLARELNASAGREESPLFRLTVRRPVSLEEVSKLVDLESPALAKRLDAKTTPLVPGTDAAGFYPDAVRGKLENLQKTARQLSGVRFPKPGMAMVAFDAGTPADIAVHVAGSTKQLGAVVPRGFPRVLGGPGPVIGSGNSGRLELARWLTRPGHPLTARVMVNRLWQWHFGEGLVRTPDNFGQLGEEPTHPRLLDWLAATFVGDGWSLKRLHRRIMLSSVYRQASTARPDSIVVDGDNRWLWRMNRRRLEAEPFRDAMLSVSGHIDPALYGTFQTWKTGDFSINDTNQEIAKFQTRRRSVYLPVVRTSLHEMMELFDVGDPNSITSRRSATTVAHQALFLMNSPFVQARSRGLAARVIAEVSRESERIERAWMLVLSRLPRPAERTRAVEYLAAARKQNGGDDQLAWASLAWALFSLNEFLYVD